MATFGSLTPAQQAIILNHIDLLIRPSLGQFARLLNLFAALRADGVVQTDALVASLDAGTVIPNTGNLAGAVPMTKEEVQSVDTAVGNILTTYNTAALRQTYAKLAGAQNTV